MRESKRIWRANNPEKCKAYLAKYLQSKREWLIGIKNSLVCKICGENRYWVLEFHHRNPMEKELSIASTLVRWGRERILKEIAKCDVLCANCHRDEHYQLNKGDGNESLNQVQN